MSHDAERAAIVVEARSWLGTPYRHATGIKGVGVDCIHLLVRTFQATGHAPINFDTGAYSQDWYLHQSEELFLKGLALHAHPIDYMKAQPGDVALYRFGRTASHGAIIIDEEYLIHAYAPHGNVELHERWALLHRLDSCWSIFP